MMTTFTTGNGVFMLGDIGRALTIQGAPPTFTRWGLDFYVHWPVYPLPDWRELRWLRSVGGSGLAFWRLVRLHFRWPLIVRRHRPPAVYTITGFTSTTSVSVRRSRS